MTTSKRLGIMEAVGTLVGHTARVWQVDWHPSLPLFASCSEDKTIRVWKVVEDQWVCFVLSTQSTLSEKHTKSVRAVAWSRSGAYLASASFDGTVIVWAFRPPLFEAVLTLEGHESEVKSVSWSVNDQFLATCGRDKTVWIWETDVDLEYTTAAVLSKHNQDVKMVLWHPSNLLLASASYDNTIIVWETNAGQDWVSRDTLTGHESTVWGRRYLAIDWVGEDLISCGDDLTMRVWRNVNGRYVLTRTVSGVHSRSVYFCAFIAPYFLTVLVR